MAEQVPFKHKVEGSSPPRPTKQSRSNARSQAGVFFVGDDAVPSTHVSQGLLPVLPGEPQTLEPCRLLGPNKSSMDAAYLPNPY